MMEVGRMCVKIAGRDAGKKCVIVDMIDNNFAMIDGCTRRRKCNLLHLEPLEQTLTIKKGASSEEIKKEFKKLGLDVWTSKPRKAVDRPRQIRAGEKKAPQEKVTKAPKAAAPKADAPKKEEKKTAQQKQAKPKK